MEVLGSEEAAREWLKQLASVWSRFDASGANAWIETLSEVDQVTAASGASEEIESGMVITIGP